MANNETTTKFKVDISELKKNFQEASRQIRLANAEFKAATSGMDSWGKSADGITAKLSQLDKVLDSQKKQLKSLEDQYALTVKEQGETSKGAQELLIRINNQKAAIGNTEKQIRTYNTKLEELQSEAAEAADSTNEQKTALEKLKNTIKDQESELKNLKDKYANVLLEQGESSAAAQNLASQIGNLSSELQDNKTKLNEAENAADEFDESLEDVDESADDAATGGISAFGVALGNVIANVVMDAISKLKDLASETIEVGKKFDSSMSNVAALSGASAEDLQKLRDTAKEYGSTTKFSATEAADALGYMALAGWDANQSADALGGVLDLAAASNMDLAKASDMVTDYLSAFGLEAKDSTKFADMLTYAQANSNTTAEGLGEAFKNCAANMNAAGQDVETTTSFLAMLANQGLKGSEAGTALTAVMRDMTAKMSEVKSESELTQLAQNGFVSSTGDLNDVLNTNAITIGNTLIPIEDANGNYRDMTDILKDVEGATQGMGDAQKASALQSTFTSDSIKGLNLILNAGVGSAADFEEELRNSTGSAKEMSEVMQDNLEGDMTSLGSKIEGVQIALYEKLEPALRSGVDFLSKLADAFSWIVDHSNEIVGALTAIATGIAAYLAYTTALKVMTDGWTALTIVTKAQTIAQTALNTVMNMNPIGLVVAAIAALVAAFIYFWNTSEDFRNFWIGLWEGIQQVASDVWEAISGFFSAAWDKIVEVWNGITEFFSGLWEGIKDIFLTIADWINENVFQPIKNFFQPVIDFFTEAWNIIEELAAGCWEAIKAIWDVVSKWFDDNIIKPIKKFFSGMWNGIKDAASTAWNGIKEIWNKVSGWFNEKIITPVKNFFSGMWDKLKNGAKDAWEGIKSVFSSVANWFRDIFSKAWQKVKDVFSAGGKVFDGIKEGIANAFKSVVNTLIRGINKIIAVPFNAINGMLDKIRDINIAGIQPFSGLISRFTVPEIPELAKGGVLRKGQVGLLEGDGAEAVVPLEKNTRWLDEIAKRLSRDITLQNNSVPQTINNNTTNNFNQNNYSPKSLSRLEIYRQSKNLLSAKGV